MATHGFALLSEDAYDRMIAAFLKLPEKGRKSFKYALIDTKGTRRTVHWDGKFYFFFNAGVKHCVGYRSDRLAELRPDIGQFDRDAFWAEMAANATGNHNRNHFVRVPTPCGQPVRG